MHTPTVEEALKTLEQEQALAREARRAAVNAADRQYRARIKPFRDALREALRARVR